MSYQTGVNWYLFHKENWLKGTSWMRLPLTIAVEVSLEMRASV
jgi:hypothetical protein